MPARLVKIGDGLEVSDIGLGCMGITAFYGPPMEEEAAHSLLKETYEQGYTHFDTAEAYSTKPGSFTDPSAQYNEVTVGKFLQTLPRTAFTVATKFFPAFWNGKVDAETVTKACEASLKRLGLDYIDLYYCHRMPESVEKLEEWMASAKALVAAGKIKHVGLSEVCSSWLRRAHAVHPVACVQQEWSLITRNLEDFLVPTCVELGVGIVAYSPLARNILCAASPVGEGPPQDWRKDHPRYFVENFPKNRELAGRIATLAEKRNLSAAQLSMAWLRHRAKAMGVCVVPIPGTTKAARAAENMAGFRADLSGEEVQKLEELGALFIGARGNEGYISRGIESQEAKAEEPNPKRLKADA
eukprot:gnl/TRDRNA2_/TRDRNA2_160119_c0_seq1.p1 gnl/TRDRNA2_/TRDRNA2_160119_c0~~gnl/TRDRNA2_/TRDRNA2_160119_c0_seq1.p1  ORF type:complete len:356 (-),score=60.57 gnl/TRDRNA2_/TRDRNA2_160119_c0_seq1:266-1333(-)